MKRISFSILIILLTVLSVPVLAQPATKTISTSIPGISAFSSTKVIQQCSPFLTTPGSVVPGANGTITVQCPNSMPALIFLVSNSTTPALTLTPGYSDAYIKLNGDPCSLPFTPVPTVGSPPDGAFLNHTLTFSSTTPSKTALLVGGYNYCFDYINAPVTGLTGFSVTWTSN